MPIAKFPSNNITAKVLSAKNTASEIRRSSELASTSCRHIFYKFGSRWTGSKGCLQKLVERIFEMKKKSRNDYRSVMSRYPLIIVATAASLFSLTIATSAFADNLFQSDNATIIAQNNAPGQNGDRPGPPPKEALSACEGKSENSSCSFNDAQRGEQLNGTCLKTPRGEAACAPDDMPRPNRAG